MGGERFLFSSRVQPKQLWWSQRSGINTKLISGKSLMVADSFQSLAHPSACTQRKGTSGTRKEGNTCAVGPSGAVPSHLTCEARSIPPAMQTREMQGDQRHHVKLFSCHLSVGLSWKNSCQITVTARLACSWSLGFLPNHFGEKPQGCEAPCHSLNSASSSNHLEDQYRNSV